MPDRARAGRDGVASAADFAASAPKRGGPPAESSPLRSDRERRMHPAPSRRLPGLRFWAWVAIVAQIAFVAAWLAADRWQGSGFSPITDSISDMYAVGVPHAHFLVVTFTDTGAATILFALLSVRPALRGSGRLAGVGSVLLALSVAGLGNLLSQAERMACRISDPGCTTTIQLSNSGGKTDSIVSTAGAVLLVIAGFVLAAAMRRIPSWRAWVRPVRWTSVLLLALLLATALTGGTSGQSGLFERLFAGVGAAAIATLAVGILRRARQRKEQR